MTRESNARHKRCPCGSGKRYEVCCGRRSDQAVDRGAEDSPGARQTRSFDERHEPLRGSWANWTGAAAGRAADMADDDFDGFPMGTIAYYGPDDRTTTKVVASVIADADADPVIQSWVGTGLLGSPKVRREMDRFFTRYGVVEATGFPFNIGCPHEEGEDFPEGADCPFCPYWRGKQGVDRWDRLLDQLAAFQEGIGDDPQGPG